MVSVRSIRGVWMKRESGANPEQTRCCMRIGHESRKAAAPVAETPLPLTVVRYGREGSASRAKSEDLPYMFF